MSSPSLKEIAKSDSIIDLQAMAAAYDHKDDEPELTPRIDFPLSAQVLLAPVVSPRKAKPLPKLALAGAALALVVVTAATTVFVARGGFSDHSDRAAQVNRNASPDLAPVAGVDIPTATESVEPMTELVEPAAEPTEPAAEPTENAVTENAPLAAPAEPTHTIRREHAEKPARREHEKETVTAAPTIVAQPEPIAPAVVKTPADSKPKPTIEAATTTNTCDEVTCLVDPAGACCKALGLGKDDNKVEEVDDRAGLPESLTRADVAMALRSYRGRIEACGDKHGFSGTANIKLHVDRDGHVISASTTAGTPAFQSCLSSRLQSARFPETQSGATLRYPVIFR